MESEAPVETTTEVTAEEVKAETTEAADQEGHEKEAAKEEEKPQKTFEQKELERARRRINTLTRRLYEREASVNAQPQQNGYDADNDEPITLTRAELQQRIQEEARRAAPTLAKQEAVVQHRQAVIAALDKDLGTERFNEVAADLDEALGGLADRNGQPKPVADAIFESEHPRQLIEYLADPDHEEEARAIGRMNAAQAARAIVKIEAKLADKPQPSKAAEPLAPVKAAGSGKKSLFEMSDKEFFESRRNHGKRK